MNEYRKRPVNFPWPPLIYVVSASIAYGLHVYFPLPIVLFGGTPAMVIGGLLIVAGIFLDFWTLKTLHDRGTTIMPNRSVTHLVTSGPFRYSRNPVYLGYTLFLTGLGFITGIAWLPVAALISAAVTYFYVIKREELHLLSRFGCDFERYRRGVRCWI